MPQCSLTNFSLFFIFFSFILALAGISPATAVNDQGLALLAWSSGEIPASWNAGDETPCNWPGVGCDSSAGVTAVNLTSVALLGGVPTDFSAFPRLQKLILSGCNLSGEIPKSIGDLKELVELDLSKNAISGEIPAEVYTLVKLESLLLNTNFLEGSISESVGDLTELRILTVYDNHLAGELPRSIGRLKKLEAIRGGGNRNLGGPIPAEIGNCSSLVVIGLAETGISGNIPRTIGMLKSLETLALYTALISGPIPEEIGECGELREIYLHENSISGSIPASIGKLKKLQNLLLWQNSLVGVIPAEIGSCTELMVIDLSINSITGKIPAEIGNLIVLEGLQLSQNRISGDIPAEIGKCGRLSDLELDNNEISGTIPVEIGELRMLKQLLLWTNKLEGNIPAEIGKCELLESLDLSQNSLTGAIPSEIFELKKLSAIMLLSNDLSGRIPPAIGNCSALIRFRAGDNNLAGAIPPEIGHLSALSFFDVGSNRLSGAIPDEISGCRNLTYLDISKNSLTGNLPVGLGRLVSLQYLDLSKNSISGELVPSLPGSLTRLTKLILSENKLSGRIPGELGSCLKLALIDLGSNELTGEIPEGLGKIPALEIALNLSLNQLTGKLPEDFTALDRLGTLDISHNKLTGDLQAVAAMQNLVVLNASDNNFSGRLPDTKFFASLPLSNLAGNPSLCLSSSACSGGGARHTMAAKAAMIALLCTAALLLLAALYLLINSAVSRKAGPASDNCHSRYNDEESEIHELAPPWEVTLYQKLDLPIPNVASTQLVPENIIGRGRTGVVYRVETSSGNPIAVKRFSDITDKYSATAFAAEVGTLAGVRHRNVVRLLGWGANRRTKLLFYSYMANGDLATLLHGSGATGVTVEWQSRVRIALGVAEGLAYLHHDCVPAILHRDVKAHNILIGERHDACLADFGLARLVQAREREQSGGSLSTNPHIAGSYGYIAPEYASMQNITTKSDVYSFGVVLMEIITGKKPIDPSFPEGQHVVQWVRDHLKSKKDPVEIIDPKLQGHTDNEIEEILQALGISLLCASPSPKDRPTMKDVAALLREIHQEPALKGSEFLQKDVTKKSEDVKKINVTTNSSDAVEMSMNPNKLLLLQSSARSLPYSSYSLG